MPPAFEKRFLPQAYNGRFADNQTMIGQHAMEAERLNAIANRIADLEGRGDQLRRYL